jgi:hypothetical protein
LTLRCIESSKANGSDFAISIFARSVIRLARARITRHNGLREKPVRCEEDSVPGKHRSRNSCPVFIADHPTECDGYIGEETVISRTMLSDSRGINPMLTIASCRALLTTLLKTEPCPPPLPRSTPEEAAYFRQRLPDCLAASERPGGWSGRQMSERRMWGRRRRRKAGHGHGRSHGGNRTQSRHRLSCRLRRGRSWLLIVTALEV